ncbi:transmembrane and TPR repeat-containing protein 2 [Lingula anatina]|uniref:dolichyl-phosphate-mannose--protein mannosyltransferase n=1 Tax=Lingula anatina TaxID=7574 RepID=A0A1S3K4P3_LINAN|nr:transmembrane and TPR repeat-containing protein 2 [Lingula anatina]|eukprot:XP_013417600.1 transmembrane and TPR repeat-containing protein 2 [Lingula anatina]
MKTCMRLRSRSFIEQARWRWTDWKSAENGRMEKKLALPCAVALLLYLNTFDADFAYDDSRAIQKNQDLLPQTPVWNLFLDDFWGTPLTHSGSHKSYRPLCVLSFRLNYYLDGLNPRGYHIGNVLLHVAVTGLYTYFAKCFLRRTFPTILAGLLFATHPIHTEAVAGVVGRADVGASLFFLLAFLCYQRFCKYRDKSWQFCNPEDDTQSRKWLSMFLVAIFTASSMLTKEQGVTVLAVCAVYDMFIQHRMRVCDLSLVLSVKKYRSLLEGLALLTAIGGCLVSFRIYLMGSKPPEFAPADNPASDSDSFLTRTLTFFYLPVVNLWLLICPSILSFDWSMESIPLVESLADHRNILTAGFYAALAVTTSQIVKNLNQQGKQDAKPSAANGNGFSHHWGSSSHYTSHSKQTVAYKRHRLARRNSSSSTDSSDDNQNIKTTTTNRTLNVLIISMATMIFPFIPATNIFFYVGFVIAERVLYLPSMGFCMLVAEGAYLLHKKIKNKGQRRAMHLLLVVLLLAFSARTVLRNEDWKTEERLYKSGISVNPAKAWGNLANIYNSQNRVDEAEQAYTAALQHRGNMADVHYNLGILLQEQKRYKDAIISYQNAIKFRPRLSLAHLNLGIVYGILGRNDDAAKVYRHCAELDITGLKDPKLHEGTKISALYNLGRLYAEQEKYQEAIDVYLEAIRRRPSHYAPQSLFNMLGEAYLKQGSFSQAEHWYQEALASKPDHIPAHLTMARLWHKRNQVSEAEKWFQKAFALDDKDVSIYQHYSQFLSDIGRHGEAADMYKKATELTPDDFELVFNAANALRQAQRNTEAEQYYRKAAHLRPKSASAHMNLGAMLHFNGKLGDAENSYLQALELKPDDELTRTNLRKLRNLMQTKGNPSKRAGNRR